MAATTNKKLTVPKKKNPGNAQTLARGAKVAKLTDKMKVFCAEYMIDKNSTAAAIRAGYNERNAHSIGFALMQKPQVKAEIERLLNEVIEECKVTHQMLTNELVKTAFSDITDFIEIKNVGTGANMTQDVVFKPTGLLEKGKSKAIKSIEIGRKGIKIVLNSKEQAIDMLAKHIGYFGVDNKQKTPQGVLMYIPDNSRGDVMPPEETEDEQ